MRTIFNVARMDRLIKEDHFLLLQFRNAVEDYPYNDDSALEVVFNTYVLEDTVMERKYNN